MNLWALVASVLLLAANAFFVGAEFALIAARRTRMEQMVAEGSALARLALASMRELNLALSGAQLGITMASLGLGFVAEPAVAHGLEALIGPLTTLPAGVVHSIAVVIALSIVVFFHMVLGEMVPKNIVIAEPERSALVLAAPVRIYVTTFRPAIAVLTGLANTCLRAVRVEPRDELRIAHSAEEIATMLGASREEGLIEEFEHELLSGALRFRERDAASIMVPRDEVVALPVGTTAADAERIAVETGHSRFPVHEDDLDRVLGFIHVKDLLRIPARRHDEPLPTDLLRPMLHVHARSNLQQVLLRMRHRQTHFALVVDRPGHVAGIVTLEDVLEQLVGDIADEHDVEPAAAERRRRRRLVRRRR